MTVVVNELDVQPPAAENAAPGTQQQSGAAASPGHPQTQTQVERAVRRRAERRHRLEAY